MNPTSETALADLPLRRHPHTPITAPPATLLPVHSRWPYPRLRLAMKRWGERDGCNTKWSLGRDLVQALLKERVADFNRLRPRIATEVLTFVWDGF